jgi:hypothetical protein
MNIILGRSARKLLAADFERIDDTLRTNLRSFEFAFGIRRYG